MNKLNDAWQALQKLPAEEQERVADAILDLAARPHGLQLTDEQVAEVKRRMLDTDEPTLTPEEVRARLRSRA
jgi:putative addiction module component (TIGR02574 family)